MLLKAVFKIADKTTRSGSNDRGAYNIDEYLILNRHERDNGEMLETYLSAVKSQNCPDIEVGGVYQLTLFITSREYQGKYYPSFRITSAIAQGNPPATQTGTSALTPEPAPVESNTVADLGDEIPF
jgi:hypothetical protein